MKITRIAPALLAALLVIPIGCSSDDDDAATEGSTESSEAGESTESDELEGDEPEGDETEGDEPEGDDPEGDDPEGGDDPASVTCSGWEMLQTFYPDADFDSLTACSDGQGAIIAGTLMNFDGITITGGSVVGADGSNVAAPCIEVLCDETYAYIASNALPHYDPVAAPIFDTIDTPIVHRIPLEPMPISATTEDTWQAPRGCDAALNMAVVDETPTAPPFSHCYYEDEDGGNSTGDLYITDGAETVHKVHCYGQTASLITGIPAFAPCEEARPDPYGSPLFATWAEPDGVFVDFCGTHPAAITHNHWINEVCLEQDEDNRPVNSYATGAVAFDLDSLDAPDCTEVSDVVGWAYDGYPMRGSCVCMERAADGTCADIRRARSGYVYAGLARWADAESDLANVDPTVVEESYFAEELLSCTSGADCCPDGGVCRLLCHPLLVEAEDGSTVHEARCGTPDYSWCGHEWIDRAEPTAEDGYVYLDRCNGIETADGYSYVGTSTFPYVNGCFRGEPTEMATDDTYIRLDGAAGGPGGGGPGGGGGPPTP